MYINKPIILDLDLVIFANPQQSYIPSRMSVLDTFRRCLADHDAPNAPQLLARGNIGSAWLLVKCIQIIFSYGLRMKVKERE